MTLNKVAWMLPPAVLWVLCGVAWWSGFTRPRCYAEDAELINARFAVEQFGMTMDEFERRTQALIVPMRVSWYGPGFHGKTTASGEVYDQWGLTCASRTLPFGTWLKVYCPRTKKTAMVRVNDRGPYIPGRALDLSRGAADALGITDVGVIDVWIRGVIYPQEGGDDKPLLERPPYSTPVARAW